MEAKYSMEMAWKDFSIDLNAVEAWMRSNAGEHYCGNSADSRLRFWFTEEPSQDIKDAIQAYWDGLHEESSEATSYKSRDQRDSEREAKKTSGKSKLKDLGLSDDEIAALLG